MPALTGTESKKDLTEILVEMGFITQGDARNIKLEQVNTGKSAKEVIREQNFVSEEQLVRAEAQLYHIPFINLAETAISPEALSLIPHPVAERFNLIPFDYNKGNNELSVAMLDPLDLGTISFIEKKSRARIKPFIATPKQITESITVAYSQTLAKEVKEALKETAPEDIESRAVDIMELGKVIRQAPIAKIVSTILEFSMKSRSSDIHIEPEEDKTRVRYRIDGILHEKLVLPKQVHEAVISRIKILSGMKIDEKRVPQDGRFNFRSGDQEVDLRVSCVPTSHGEKIVMRLLKKGQKMLDLPELGLRGMALKSVKEAILRPHGIIIVCGPTGSGKTTTLYAALMRINTPKINIMTLEDPVEYAIAGVNQVQINPAAGLTFASGLRSFVRQDPDVIMVGEIRDKETTSLATQAALTGHLVFSTLHTNDAAGAVPRMIDLGAEPFLLASALTCVAAQRVVRKICEECRESYSPPKEVAEDMKQVLGKLYPQKAQLVLQRGKKCPKCNETGYHGRIGVFEVMPISEKIGRLILERTAAESIEKQAVAEGMITMKQDGYLKVLEGMTTIEEVLRVAED